MRKLEGLVKEVVEELDYLKAREVRFASTNGEAYRSHRLTYEADESSPRINTSSRERLRCFHIYHTSVTWSLADIPLASIL